MIERFSINYGIGAPKRWLIIWMIDYIKSWDGLSRSLYLTALAARPRQDALAVGQPPNPPADIVSGLSGRKLTPVVARPGQKRVLLPAGAETALSTSHETLSPERLTVPF